MGDPPDYEPGVDASVAGIAAREGRSPIEVLFDLIFSDGARAAEQPRRELQRRVARVRAGDDAQPGHHVRPRRRRCACEPDVRRQHDDVHAQPLGTRSQRGRTPAPRAGGAQDDRRHRRACTASAIAAASRRAAWATSTSSTCRVCSSGGPSSSATSRPVPPRLIQRADGYAHTVKSGAVVFTEGEHTGALPGTLLRGARDS